jgi:drug/metabolite transporter (DMT)-like permease
VTGLPVARRPSLALAWLVLVYMGATWGMSFSLARIATRGGVHPIALTFWEAAIAGVILLGVIAFRQMSFGFSLRHLFIYFVTAILGMVVPGIGFFYAAAHVSAGVLSLTVAVVPIFTLLMSALLKIEAMQPVRFLGLALGIAAIVLLVAPSGSLGEPGQTGWVIIAFVTALSYGVLNIVLASWNPKGAASVPATCGMFLMASLLLLPSTIYVSGFDFFGETWTSVQVSVVALGVINAVAYAALFWLNTAAGPVFTSQTANLVTFFGVAWGIVLFGESHSKWVWLSFATMMLALALVRPRRSAAPKRGPAPVAAEGL